MIVIDSDKFLATETGLVVAPDVTYDEWAAYGKELAKQYSALQWKIGDWINIGEAHFGEMYAQALDDTHFAYGTLRNYASICARIPPENRHPKLRFHQIKHVASLEPHEQRAIIDAAVKHEMTGDDIQEAVQRVQGKKPQAHESVEGTIIDWRYSGGVILAKIEIMEMAGNIIESGRVVTIRAK